MRDVSVVATTLLMMHAMFFPAAGAAEDSFPDVLSLPTAFQPEGIATGPGSTFYAGSLADGTILVGDLRTGESQVLVPGQEGRLSVGMSFDARSGFLFVAGGLNGVGRVYDSESGVLLAEYPMFSGGQFGDFINDVVVTRDAAYFSNSFAPFIYRVPLGPAGELPNPPYLEEIPLIGDWFQVPGFFVFNANGIEATANGKTLIVVNSVFNAVYRVDPETGVATPIDLGEALPSGDGLLLIGKTLYVVQNQLNQIGVISLSPDLGAGSVGVPITDLSFNIPTTAAKFGNSLYVVNAKFGSPPGETDYEIVKVLRN